METSPQRATDKKDKMDSGGFADLPKKPSPSETRGKALLETFSPNQLLDVSLAPWRQTSTRCESRSPQCSARGQREEQTKWWNIHFKDKVPSQEPMLMAVLRYQQQSEVTYSRCLRGILSRPRAWASIINGHRGWACTFEECGTICKCWWMGNMTREVAVGGLSGQVDVCVVELNEE